VPPQEKCGVGLFVSIFFVFLHFAHAQGKKTKKDFHFNPSRKKTEVSINWDFQIINNILNFNNLIDLIK
jgi:hypothetical protein